MNSQHNIPQNVQNRHENQKMNASIFSLTKTKHNPCLCVVCANILLNKLKTLFGEEKKLSKQKLINPHEKC
jgi:hypothetical protein